MPIYKKQRFAWALSVLLHVACTLSLLSYYAQSPTLPLGDNKEKVLFSYLIDSSKSTFNANQLLPGAKGMQKKAETARKTSPNKTLIKMSHSAGKEAEALLVILHQAIQAHQHYPDSALALNREGKATVAFELDQNGQVGEVTLATSSGTQSLDQAAIEAVKAASPFKDATAYLRRTQTFSIDVIFAIG